MVAHVAGPYFLPRSSGDVHLPLRTGPNSEEDTLRNADQIKIRRDLTLEKASLELRELLVDVVTEFESPVLATLSSGMDSSAVVAALVRGSLDVTAVTFVSSVPEADESKWAHLSAASLGVRLIEVPVSPADLLPAQGVVTRPESPMFNMFDSAWAALGDAAQAHQFDSVVTGMSGDHLFGGWVPSAADLLLAGRPFSSARHLQAASRGTRVAANVRTELVDPIARQVFRRWWARRAKPVAWLHPAHFEKWRRLQRASLGPGISPGRAERLSRLLDDSARHLAEIPALSSRGIAQLHPLLHPRLVEFALSLPSWLLNDGAHDKLVLRHAMRGWLPDQIVMLPNILPAQLAVRAIRLRREPLEDLTHEMRAADLGIVIEEPLRAEMSSFFAGDHNRMEFWNALTLEDWLRRWW